MRSRSTSPGRSTTTLRSSSGNATVAASSNLFTRRLYTLQGQQTFDEIRKKYQRDEDFRTAVDRYIARFREAARRGQPQQQGRNAGNAYLTSDTGKVYTMLAHASGRFD